jgi:glycosyltransferase involved in cell wall biosynthesis
MKKKKKKKSFRTPHLDLVHRFLDSAVKLSLCMIVKNEEQNLPLCIAPLKSVLDEIVVVDTGSTDETKEVARQLGARVFDFPWVDDFSAARNESIRRATGDYVLWLDGDDRFDESEVQKLARLKSMLSPRRDKGYYLYVNNQSPVDGETHFYQLRIFPKVPGAEFQGRVHEQIFHRLNQLGIPLIQTDIILRHTGYPNASAVIQKSERNLRLIHKEMEADPENPILHYNAARTLAGIQRQAEAIPHLKRVTDNPEVRAREKQFFLEAALLLGRYYIELQELDRAYEVFQELASEFPNHGLARFCLGEILFLRKEFGRAKEELEKSLLLPVEVSLFPVNLGKLRYYQYYMLGQCQAESGEIGKSREMFQKSLNLHKDHYKSWEALGLLALREGNFADAAMNYSKALQAGARTDSSYANLGLAYGKMGCFKDAEVAFLQALEMNPRRLEALVNLGHLYKKNMELQKAIGYFQNALEQSPHRFDIRLTLSNLYFRSQELERLVEQCDALLGELNLPRDLTINNFQELSSLYGMIGDTLKGQGRQELSLMAYQDAFLIFPSREIMEKMIPQAASLGILNSCTEEMAQAVRFHGQEVSLPGAN